MNLSDYPPVTIAVITNVLARYNEFNLCLQRIQLPPNSVISTQLGFETSFGRNQAIKHMKGEYILFMDDDHDFKPDLVHRLLEADKDIVTAVKVQRSWPHMTLLYDGVREAEDGKGLEFIDHYFTPDDVGLKKIYGCGAGAMLVKRKVVEAMPAPWFEVGHVRRDLQSEDIWFCHKANLLGFEVWCDFDTAVGHMTPMSAWPYRDKKSGMWLTAIVDGENHFVATRAAVPADKIGAREDNPC